MEIQPTYKKRRGIGKHIAVVSAEVPASWMGTKQTFDHDFGGIAQQKSFRPSFTPEQLFEPEIEVFVRQKSFRPERLLEPESSNFMGQKSFHPEQLSEPESPGFVRQKSFHPDELSEPEGTDEPQRSQMFQRTQSGWRLFVPDSATPTHAGPEGRTREGDEGHVLGSAQENDDWLIFLDQEHEERRREDDLDTQPFSRIVERDLCTQPFTSLSESDLCTQIYHESTVE